ncbi:MAG: Flp pilus assembly protein CpaB [Oscillospiraceae bacterium]|jgi:pilus assembly protein CpaB|nr:Flp pilus assembly protein CpaB [Oscillospiraceae bacterium]
MKRIFRSRLLVAAVCVLLAGLVAFVLLPNAMEQKENTAIVIRAAKDIPKGTQITEGHVERTEVGSYNLPGGTITDQTLAIGQYAALDILEHSSLTEKMLTSVKYETLIEEALAQGRSLITVSLSSVAAGGGGHVRSGDRVSILLYKEYEGADGQTVSLVEEPQILQGLLVYATQDSRANIMEGVLYEETPKSMTLLVTDAQAKALVAAEYGGQIHVKVLPTGEAAE